MSSLAPSSAPSTLIVAPVREERIVGDYRLERRVGRGAMGEVWLGRHVRTGGVAAVKVLRSGARERVVRFFARERRAIARLSHPHVVSLFELGPDFIVTAYIDGSDLARRLQTPIDPARAVEITLQIASALAHAHESLIVHRDVKPSNILLDLQGNAFLADFGLAQMLDEAEAGVGDRAGTPHYMAPEQARGEPAGPASDQYALARTLLEMLAAGSVPLDPLEALRHLPASLPADLIAVVRRATAPDPVQRWPSIEAFATALAGIALGALPAPTRLLPQVRVRTPFAWAAAADAAQAIGPETARADYRLSQIEAAGLLPREACERFRERTGYSDFGWSILGRTNRLGPITDPAAFARATEIVLLAHGAFCTREAWMGIATPLTRDHAQALVVVPDLGGFGVSRQPRPTPAQVSPRGVLEAILAFLELIGVRELPTVMLGHSVAATALLTATDEELGPRTSRVALTPVFPAIDRALYWTLRIGAPIMRWLGVLPGMRRLIALAMFVWSPAVRMYTRGERELMARNFMAVPLANLAQAWRALAEAKPATGDRLRRCTIIYAENDPMAPLGRTLEALERLAVPPQAVYRLACDGHSPHSIIDDHPEWTQRNIHEIVAIVDHLMVSSRDGTLLPTQVASTVASTGDGTTEPVPSQP